MTLPHLLLAALALAALTTGAMAQATSIFDREQCGRLGQRCCALQVEQYQTIEACIDDTLYCLDFPTPDLASGIDAGGSAAPGQPLSLCLPRPDGCGAAGGVCCPLTGNRSDASQRCAAENTICLSPQGDTIFGDLTYELYLALQKDPATPISNAVALSVWGSCQAFNPGRCGLPGGLCGTPLPPPAPQCPQSARDCSDGYYCKLQEGQVQQFGLCTTIPNGCGQLGADCCPFGNYSTGAYPTPFCDPSDVYCAAQADDVANATCRQLPRSPQECGAPGGPCCPSSAGLITDKPLPPNGSYCNYPGNGTLYASPTPEGGTCVENVGDCGRIAKPCCIVNGRSGLLFTCGDGFYCPEPGDAPAGGGDGATSGGVTKAAVGLGDRVCQECTPLVPSQYQAACGIGIGSGDSPSPEPCNPVDYYCPGDYAASPDYAPGLAPGPYSYVLPPEPTPAPAPTPVDEAPPPLGPPQLEPLPAPAPGLAPQPSLAPESGFGIAEGQSPAPASSPPLLPPLVAPAPAPAPGPATPAGEEWASVHVVFEELQQALEEAVAAAHNTSNPLGAAEAAATTAPPSEQQAPGAAPAPGPGAGGGGQPRGGARQQAA